MTKKKRWYWVFFMCFKCQKYLISKESLHYINFFFRVSARWLRTTSILIVIGECTTIIQRQLSEKLKIYSQFLIIVLEFILNLEHFEKKWVSWLTYFWSFWLWKTCLHKRIKSLVSENPSVQNVLMCPKNWWNL